MDAKTKSCIKDYDLSNFEQIEKIPNKNTDRQTQTCMHTEKKTLNSN